MRKENRASAETLREIGIRMRHIRDSLGLLQENMARDLTVTRTILSNVENGKVAPSFDVLLSLFKKFDINIHYLLEGKGEMFRANTSVVPVDGFSYQMNKEDTEFFKLYFQSNIVRLETLSKFSMLMVKEGNLISSEIERRTKGKTDNKGEILRPL